MIIPDNLTASEIKLRINERIVGKHAMRNREILYRRIIDGICYEPLAEEFNMSVRQVKNIVYAGENKIFSKERQSSN